MIPVYCKNYGDYSTEARRACPKACNSCSQYYLFIFHVGLKAYTIIFNKYSLHYLAIFLLVVVVVWVEELPNTMCSTFTQTAPVATQQECQSNCAQDSECVGILYSYKLGSTHHCYVCKDDNLLEATNNFGFYRRYRRPGNVHGYQFKLSITDYFYC